MIHCRRPPREGSLLLLLAIAILIVAALSTTGCLSDTIIRVQPTDTVLVTHEHYDTVKVAAKPDTVTLAHYDTVIVLHHDTTYVPKHDTTYVPKHDTTYVPKHDTTYVPKLDTIIITHHDTSVVTLPGHVDTITVPHADTVIVPHFVHDTTVVQVYHTDTLFAGAGSGLHVFNEYYSYWIVFNNGRFIGTISVNNAGWSAYRYGGDPYDFFLSYWGDYPTLLQAAVALRDKTHAGQCPASVLVGGLPMLPCYQSPTPLAPSPTDTLPLPTLGNARAVP